MNTRNVLQKKAFVIILLACVMLGLTASMVMADEPKEPVGPAAVAAGAAVADVVLKVIGGLSAWVSDQSDDCYAAVLASAWGKDCTTIINEEKDTGWTSVYISQTADNACGHAFGSGLAQESIFGSWAGQTVSPYASAWAYGLHPSVDGDYHGAKGWGSCGVDGHVKATTEETPPPAPGAPPATESVDGDVVLGVTIQSISVSTLSHPLGYSNGSWKIDAYVDGLQVFHTAGSLNMAGTLQVEGDIPASAFTTAFDPTTNSWNASLSNYTVDVPITHLEEGESAEMDVKVDGEAKAEDFIYSDQLGNLTDLTYLPDGSIFYLSTPKSVTTDYMTFVDGSCYIEEPLRSAGMKVIGVPPVSLGDMISFRGFMGTDENGQRYAHLLSVESWIEGGDPLSSIGMPNNVICPADGLNTTGLLAKTWGRVIGPVPGGVYITDGPLIGPVEPASCIKVVLDEQHPGEITKVLDIGNFVLITGLAGSDLTGGEANRAIRPRNDDDIVILQHHPIVK